MKKSLIIIPLFVFGMPLSCSEKFDEKSVMEEVVSRVVDSIGIDSRLLVPPPPPNSPNYSQKIELWSKQNDSIKNDTSKVVIAINAKMLYRGNSNFEKLASFYGVKKFANRFNDSSLTINIDNIEVEKFQIKSLDEFPPGMEIWNRNYNFNLSGVIKLSRIEFDSSHNFGILSAGFTCGGKCGQGFLIYVRKTNFSWQIDKIENTWMI